MGERPVVDARADTGSATARGGLDIDLEVRRIAEQVRRVTGAGAVLISTVDDGPEGLRIVATAGSVTGGNVDGRTWLRSDLDRCLGDAERHDRMHFTERRSLTYVEVADDERGIPGHGTLLMPLSDADDQLLGVLSADGPVDPRELGGAACDLIGVYAGQARLALHHRHERAALAERLRFAEATQSILQRAAAESEVPSVLAALVRAAVEVLDVRAAWVCCERAPGAAAEASAYPEDVGDRLGPDICDVVEPSAAICRAEDRVLTDADDDALAKVAAHAGHARVLLAALGRGTPIRGGLLLFRDSGDPDWGPTERAAALAIGRAAGRILREVGERDHDRRLLDELRDLDRYKRDLVASLSHDLKGPLTSITLNADILATDRETADAGGAEQVAAIRRSADRLSRLVDDLLALARAEEAPVRPSPEVDVAALVREAWQHVELEAREHGVEISADLPDSMPLSVDADALRRVFVQIVANAVKFSPQGGQVRLALRWVDDVAEFSCADDGIGIAAEDQSAVFDMFRRADDPAVSVVPGTGMGLAIAHRIVSRLGGTIDVASVRGEGSTFTVRIP